MNSQQQQQQQNQLPQQPQQPPQPQQPQQLQQPHQNQYSQQRRHSSTSTSGMPASNNESRYRSKENIPSSSHNDPSVFTPYNPYQQSQMFDPTSSSASQRLVKSNTFAEGSYNFNDTIKEEPSVDQKNDNKKDESDDEFSNANPKPKKADGSNESKSDKNQANPNNQVKLKIDYKSIYFCGDNDYISIE